MDYNVKAANWDNETRIKRAKMVAAEIIKSINIDDQYSAMEFGCGTGLVSFNLKDKFKHITLIDISESMMEILNSKIRDSKVDNITPILTDINENIEVIGDKYDVIYTSMALHHILDVRTTVENLYKMLKDNGYFCIAELVEDNGSFHRSEEGFNGHNGFNQDMLKDTLEEIGFKDVKSHIFYSDVKVVGDLEVNFSLFLMIGRR
jgi:ubiquinone/menaquinone biosynthesis C-methylase UbiE